LWLKVSEKLLVSVNNTHTHTPHTHSKAVLAASSKRLLKVGDVFISFYAFLFTKQKIAGCRFMIVLLAELK